MVKMQECRVPICRRTPKPKSFFMTLRKMRKRHSSHNIVLTDFTLKNLLWPRPQNTLIHNGGKP